MIDNLLSENKHDGSRDKNLSLPLNKAISSLAFLHFNWFPLKHFYGLLLFLSFITIQLQTNHEFIILANSAQIKSLNPE